MARLPDLANEARPLPKPSLDVAQLPTETGLEMVPARNMAASGAELTQFGEKLEKEFDETRVNDVFANQFSPQLRNLYQQYYTKQGKDAVDAMPQFTKAMQDLRAQAVSTLGSSAQKNIFTQMAGRRIDYELDGMARYADTQLKVYGDQTHAAMITNYRNQAADYAGTGPANEHGFGTALGSGIAEIDRYAMSTGKPPEWARAKAQEFTSQSVVDRISRTMVSDPLAAQQLYKEYAHEVDAGHRVVLEHQLRTAVLPVEAKSIADKVMTTADVQNLDTAITVKGEAGVQQVASQDVIGAQPQQGAELHRANIASIEAEIKKSKSQRAIDILHDELAAEKKLLVDAEKAGATAAPAASVSAATPVTLGANETPTRTRDTRAMLGTWIANAERMAQETHPNDPLFRDMVVQNVKGRVATIVQMQEGVQRQAQGALIQASIGSNNTPPPTSTNELFAIPGARQAFTLMDEAAQRGIVSLLDHNARTAAGENVRSNPAVVQQLFNRIHADESDPNKIRSTTQLTPFFGNDSNGHAQLSRSDYDWMKKEIEASRTPEGNVFLRDVQNLRRTALSVMKQGIVGRMLADAQPEKIEEAAYAFNLDLDRKIDEYRKAGKDPRALLTPGTPDYALAPGRVQSFLQSPQSALSDAAKKAAGILDAGNIDLNKRPIVRNADGTISTVRSMSFNEDGKEVLIPTVAADGSRVLSDKEAIEQYRKSGQFLGKFTTPEAATNYAKQLHEDQAKRYARSAQYEVGKVYEFKQGKVKYLGGDALQPASWEPAK